MDELTITTKYGIGIGLDTLSAMLVINEDSMIRINDVANLAGKRVENWTRTKRTKDLIKQFEKVVTVKGVTTKQAGYGIQGTWVHKDLVHSFLMWCFPGYEILVNKLLQKIFGGGISREKRIKLRDYIEKSKYLKNLYEENSNKLIQVDIENKQLIIDSINSSIELEEAILSKRGVKSQETRKRNILDDVKDLLGVRNDRDIVSSLENLFKDYNRLSCVIDDIAYESISEI